MLSSDFPLNVFLSHATISGIPWNYTFSSAVLSQPWWEREWMHSKMSRQQWKEFTHPKSSLEQALLRRMKAVSRCKAAGGLTWTSSHKFSLPKHFVHTKAHLDSCIRIPLSFQLWIFSALSAGPSSLSLSVVERPPTILALQSSTAHLWQNSPAKTFPALFTGG